MIDGERRGFMAANEALAPVIEEARASDKPVRLPSDDEMGQLAADAWVEFQSRGYAHIEPREAFLRGYGMAVRQLLMVGLVVEPEAQDDTTVAWDLQGGG